MVQNIPTTKLVLNTGQIDGLPQNPRFIRDERFNKLVKSIQDAPEMLDYRTLLVYPFGGKYVVVAGNMRLRACKQIGYKELPCYVLPEETTAAKLREYAIKDNVSFGSDDFDLLANEWNDVELADWGVEFPRMGLEDVNADEPEPTDLDGEDKNKPFAIKITFESDEKLNEFRDKYEKIIQDEFKVIISVSGGEL
jgi:hypothetical protein